MKISKTDNILVPHTNNEYKVVIYGGAIIEGSKKSVETLLYVVVSSNKVCWVAEASMYTFMFVMYAEIVHVQCYRGWYVETGYTNTIFGKL